MKLSNLIACICEGAAEEAIIELLLESDKLIFNRQQLLEEQIIRCRKAENFEKRYLRKGFSEKISIIRILDSRKERFKLSNAYKEKIDIINIVTSPEIEMLIIFKENKYSDFKKSRRKPSEFCSIDLHYHNVKSKTFIKHYFKDIETLIYAIQEYRRISRIPKEEYCLTDLLR